MKDQGCPQSQPCSPSLSTLPLGFSASQHNPKPSSEIIGAQVVLVMVPLLQQLSRPPPLTVADHAVVQSCAPITSRKA